MTVEALETVEMSDSNDSMLEELKELIEQLNGESKKEPIVPKLKFPDSALEFLELILEHHPRNTITLKKLISIGQVIYSAAPGVTAAVMNSRPITLMFGKPFIEEHMWTIEDCVYLLHHELTHLVLDHFAPELLKFFADKNLAQAAINIVVDCQVNATCHHTLDDPKYFEFIKRFYPQDQMPFCFMRADGLCPTEKLQDLHNKLYSIDGITNEELVEGLMEWFKEQQDKLNQFVEKLLGNHEDILKGRGSTGQNDDISDITQEVGQASSDYLRKKKEEEEKEKQQGSGQGQDKDSFEKPDSDKDGSSGKKDGEEEQEKKQGKQKEGEGEEKGDQGQEPEKGGKQAGTGGSPRLQQIDTTLAKLEYNRRIRDELKRSQTVFPASQLWKAIDYYTPKLRTRGVIPNFHDRRTVALYSQGVMPVFHRHATIGAEVIVPCYVDVSGSQSHVLDELLPAVSRLRNVIGHKVYCFSDTVSETEIKDLARGKYYTSGGTNFNPVASHILKNKFRFAIILTDGHAPLNDELVTRLTKKGIHITVLWTQAPSEISRSPLDQIAAREMFFFVKDNNAPIQ